ncbi:MAG: hypothetical protein ACD_10C00337G0003 [uncultured bacterium]|nr:MAG: hypothetical protein ACD_10C00337G0003 [uncultured bacterium]
MTIAFPVTRRSAGDIARLNKIEGTRHYWNIAKIQPGTQVAALAKLQQMAEQAETRHIGHRMHAVQTGQHRTRRIQLRRAGDHGLVIAGVQLLLFERGAINADTECLAENQFVARPGGRVAFEMCRVDQPDGNQAINRLDRIDSMTAGNWNPCGPANRCTASKNLADGFKR